MINLYGIPNCTSVKKAKNLLDSLNIPYTEINVKKEPVSKGQVEEFAQKVGINMLLNAQGTTYRKLNLKALNLSHGEKIDWMHREQTLMKRPVLQKGDQVMVGFDEEKIRTFVR